MKFYLRLILFFFIFLGGYSLLLGFATPSRIPKQSWWQHNRMRAEAFLTEGKNAEYILTGSSMSDRMIPDKNSRWFNLSLVGEGALTGLSLLAKSDLSPKFVLIEVNQLSVKENSKFAEENTEEFFVFTHRKLPILLSENQPFNFLAGLFLDLPSHLPWLKMGNPTTTSPSPTNTDAEKKLKAEHLEETIRWYGAPVEQSKLKERVESVRSFLDVLSKRGVRPIFFEIPMHPKILSSPKETRTRETFRENFPESEYIWYFAKKGPYEDSDALHLTYPEANRFFAELKEYAESLK
ncbi:hypothetical protein [Leptospira wolffii]|uniref:hypothetical protein n=1 Tax=Leptospira wolffii TaxID=409998 RepID=UPI00030D0367|nr:hypothetical protein [Leptospira wolffii]EPG66956.1 hypothetical protein LEP1GSC061_1193 [Leptospira wolffii serovar Khorat str. Khorat-H2]